MGGVYKDNEPVVVPKPSTPLERGERRDCAALLNLSERRTKMLESGWSILSKVVRYKKKGGCQCCDQARIREIHRYSYFFLLMGNSREKS